jgi:uncharacterized membrane protein
MKYIMQQTRDGAVELIDRSPAASRERAKLFDWKAGAGWATVLIWFMRTLAWVWIAKGLFNWSIILGANLRFGEFAAMSLALQGTIVTFACIDFVAAVGLWLAAPWGGVIWLLCAGAEAVTPLISTRSAEIGLAGVAINAGLIAAYFVLSWLAARAARR